jgi:hypothetical protein
MSTVVFLYHKGSVPIAATVSDKIMLEVARYVIHRMRKECL